MEIEITKRYKLPESRLYRRGIHQAIEIEEVIITGKLTQNDESKNLEFRLIDKVWLIMKSIFEEKSFSFSKNGLIIEHKK